MRKKLQGLCMMLLASFISTAVFALEKNAEGVYKIGSAEDFKAFAELVNGGEAYANAVLTADIDLGTELPMIGEEINQFKGIFDGQGHSITINAYPVWDEKEHGSAIFGRINGNALIKDLKVQGTITTNQKYACGIAAKGRGTVRGCWIDLTVVSSFGGDATHGGVVGVGYEGLLVEDCLVKYTVNGSTTQNCGGITGWADGKVTVANTLIINEAKFDLSNGGSGTVGRNGGNLAYVDVEQYNGGDEPGYSNRPRGACYNNYATQVWNDGANGRVTITNADALASGQICYQLNNDQTAINWVQNIGDDAYPVPVAFGKDKKQVYASGATGCNGLSEEALTYSNEGTAQATAHTIDKFGVCTVCGKMLYEKLDRDITDNSFIVRTVDDFIYLEGVNRSQNGGWFNISLANDLEYTSDAPGHMLFNNDNWYSGNFDGRGHTMTINYTEAPTRGSLFPQLRGTVRNVKLTGTISGAAGAKNLGSVTGITYGATAQIENVYSDVNIYANCSGDNTTGGIIGLGETDYKLTNVIYAGTIQGIEGTEAIAGITGWNSGRGVLDNVAFIGDLVNAGGDSWTIGRRPTAVANNNCYILNEGCAPNKNVGFTVINPEDVESGELAYLLNGGKDGVERFFQTIGTDSHPYPYADGGHGKLYLTSPDGYRCDGASLGKTVYVNSEPVKDIPDHNFVDGFCTVCGGLDMDYIIPAEDGWYEVGTPAQLIWWANYAAKYDLGASMRLTADIDMTGYENYPVIGTETNPYYGSVDGQLHVISNLIIDHPEAKGVGFIGVMNSVPTKSQAKDADRDGAPVYIRNLVLDETCFVTAQGYVGGILGLTSAWQGAVEVSRCVVRCAVTATEAANAGGIHGCCMASTCRIDVKDCGVTSTIHGPSENGVISGWMGNYGHLTNCWSISEVYEGENLVSNFVRSGGLKEKENNWWTKDQENVVTNKFKLEIVPTGELAYVLNNKQFKEPVWYQRLGEDEVPYLDPERGVVAYLGDTYYSIYDDASLSDAAAGFDGYVSDIISEAVAYRATIEALEEQKSALDGCADYVELAETADAVNKCLDKVRESQTVYKAYIDKCEETIEYLATHDDFEGEVRDALEAYLNDEMGPGDENPIGSYSYVTEKMEAANELVEKETARLAEWLAEAIATGYMPGANVTNLLANPTFAGNFDGWQGKVGTGTGSAVIADGKTVWGGETWATTLDMTQTVENLKPGYYLVRAAAAYRPGDNRYSYNHIARFTANDNANFLMTVYEDPIMVDEAIDGTNCHTTGTTPDYSIWEDEYTTSSDEVPCIGYVARGPHGLAIAGSAERYINYIAAEVGEDGKLTVGFVNEGSDSGNDWVGYSDVRLTYLGTAQDEASADLSYALESQTARANAILAKYVFSEGIGESVAKAPNFPQELRAALEAAVTKAQGASTAGEKMACIKEFSDIFNAIYEGKKAYTNMFKTSLAIEASMSMLLGNISDEDYNTALDLAGQLTDAYYEGSYSNEQAKALEVLNQKPLADIIPETDEDGVYQIGNPLNMLYFSGVVSGGNGGVNAVLTNDIDMAGYSYYPAGTALDGTVTRYTGTFDGQNHALKNLTIGSEDEPFGYECVAPFNDIENANVKNLAVQGVFTASSKYIAGIAGRTRNATISNCEVNVVMNTSIIGDGTHGGIVGVNEADGTVVSNCYVHATMVGAETNSCGGVIGWASGKVTLNNLLVINDVQIGTGGCNSISRNPDNCTANTTYYVTAMGDTNKGTQISDKNMLKNGSLTWILNGQKGDGAWYQTLGADTIPHLFGGDKVWYYDGEYTNSEPNIQLNAFAYNVEAGTDESQVSVTYTLNAEAEAVDIVFSDAEGNVVATVPADGLTAGQHLAVIDNATLGTAGTTLTYEVKVTGIGTKIATKMGESYKTWCPFGLAVNNTPASPGFGQVYMIESDPDTGEKDGYSNGTYTGYISDVKHSALYVFTPEFEQILGADGTPGFKGGLETKKGLAPNPGNYVYDLKSVRVSNDGRLFIGRSNGLTNSPVLEADPANLDADWTPLFTGGELDETTGIVYSGGEEQARMVSSLAVGGEGENLKLWMLGSQYSKGGFNYTDYACLTYDLGAATTWSAPASSVFEPLTGQYTIASGSVNIVADPNGGLWYAQHRGTPSEAQPALKHYNAEGKEDYSDIRTVVNSGAFAISADGEKIAFPTGAGTIAVYETNYAPMPNGWIYLDPKCTVKTTETAITAAAFDYAGNLYVASNGSETISRYAVPSDNKVVSTPAAKAIVVGDVNMPVGIESVNGADESNGAIYNIAGQRVSKAQNGIFIQNGKKISVK